MQFQPFHQRRLLIIRQSDPYPNYNRVVSEDRWWPLYRLMRLAKADFNECEIGALLRLKDEYEGGVGRKG